MSHPSALGHCRLGAMCALVALTGACAVQAPPLSIAPPLPTEFVAAGSEPVAGRWWDALNEPVLSAQIERALTQNPGVEQVVARLDAARATARLQGAEHWPSLTASASGNRGLDAADTGTVKSVDLSASYEVDLWGRVRAGRDSAVLDAEASAQALAAAQLALAANVAIQWYQIGTTQQLLASVQRQRGDYETVLHLVELRYRNGQATAADVLQQRQLVESTRSLEAGTLADLTVQRHALDALLGEPAGSTLWMPAAPDQMPALPKGGVPAEVVAQRPDVQQAWLNVASADRSVAAAVANRFPQLNLSLGYSTTDAGIASLFDEWLGSLVAAVAMPLIDGGARRAEVDRTRALMDEQLAAYRETVLAAFGEVQDAWVQDRQQQVQLNSLEEQLRLSEQVVERQLRQLRNGDLEFPSLLDAQISNGSLRRDVLAARQQLMTIRITLYRALAGPIPTEATT